MTEQKKNVKIWTATRDSKAGIMVTEKKAYMVANSSNYISISENGAVISGNSVVLNTMSENIRNGGIFVKMNDFVQMIPTTLVTPMPAQVPYPPLAFASEIIEDLPLFFAMSSTVIT